MKKTIIVALLVSLCALAQENEPDCHLPANSLPDSTRKIGQEDMNNPIRHVIVVMQENHSFDNYFGKLDESVYTNGEVDGLKNSSDPHLYHLQHYCIKDLKHSWNSNHDAWDNGKNDNFSAIGESSFGYFDEGDLNYYYALADRFAIGDRYFSSVMAPTFPNRMFMLTASSYGEIQNNLKISFLFKNRKTIFDSLSDGHVSWKYYLEDIPAIALNPVSMFKHLNHLALMNEFAVDLKKDKLPSVIFLDHSLLFLNEEPPKDPQKGERAIAARIKALIHSKHWKDSVVLFTYDEGGGFYDHVAPPKACLPDNIAPSLKSGDYVATYDRYGYRVPFVAISPYAKKHYVSHVVYDHTSILKFIENKFNLPALTKRDANANDLMDMFDFKNPDTSTNLPAVDYNKEQAKQCWGHHPDKFAEQ